MKEKKMKTQKNTPAQIDEHLSEISILAGNSRVNLDSYSGLITMDFQKAAFHAALERAKVLKAEFGMLPKIFIALDHRGIFRKQFLVDGLTNSQKRKPKLSQLKPEILSYFQKELNDFGITADEVFVIHEDSARSHVNHIIMIGDVPIHLIRLVQTQIDLDGEENANLHLNGKGQCDVSRPITCAAITSEYYNACVSNEIKVLEVYFENDPWSKVETYMKGAILSEALGNTIKIKLKLVSKEGKVFGNK